MLDRKYNDREVMKRAEEVFGINSDIYKNIKNLKNRNTERILDLFKKTEYARDESFLCNLSYVLYGVETDVPLVYYEKKGEEIITKKTYEGVIIDEITQLYGSLVEIIDKNPPFDKDIKNKEKIKESIKNIKNDLENKIKEYKEIKKEAAAVCVTKEAEFLNGFIDDALMKYEGKENKKDIKENLASYLNDEKRMWSKYPKSNFAKYLMIAGLPLLIVARCIPGLINPNYVQKKEPAYSIVAEINGQKTEIKDKLDVKSPAKIKILSVKADGNEISDVVADIVSVGDCNDIGKEIGLNPGNYKLNVLKLYSTGSDINVLPGEQPTYAPTQVVQPIAVPTKVPTQSVQPKKVPTKKPTPKPTPHVEEDEDIQGVNQKDKDI